MEINYKQLHNVGDTFNLYKIGVEFIRREHVIELDGIVVNTEVTETPIMVIQKTIGVTIKEIEKHQFKNGEYTLNDHGNRYRAEDSLGNSYYKNWKEYDARGGDRMAPMAWMPDQKASESNLKTLNSFNESKDGKSFTISIFVQGSYKTLVIFTKEGENYKVFKP